MSPPIKKPTAAGFDARGATGLSGALWARRSLPEMGES